jgi:2-polyprenyl-6-methoxyphenol hydroxylase-like FAD-dependent oxidoreductase
MAEQLHADVVVVGAGPVGLTLAMDLAWRGVDVIVLESRAPGEPPSVKSNHVSARSMEIFRRLGVAQKVRDEGGRHAKRADLARLDHWQRCRVGEHQWYVSGDNVGQRACVAFVWDVRHFDDGHVHEQFGKQMVE